jgi:hypothetical protein
MSDVVALILVVLLVHLVLVARWVFMGRGAQTISKSSKNSKSSEGSGGIS